MSDDVTFDDEPFDGTQVVGTALGESMDAADEGVEGVPEAPRTGDPGVDEAVARLREAVGRSLDGQVAAYDGVHRALQDRLADVEG